MAYDSKKFIDYIVKTVAKIEKGNPNPKLLKDTLEAMSEPELQVLMKTIEAGEPLAGFGQQEFILPYYIPPAYSGVEPPLNSWLGLADEIGCEVFTQIWTADPVTGTVNLSNDRRPILMLEGRRMKQNIDDKLSYAKDSDTRDELTGQTVGSSKSSSFSLPEANSVAARDNPSAVIEYMAARGGDVKATRALTDEIAETGGASLENALEQGSGIVASQTIDNYWVGIHLESTIGKG